MSAPWTDKREARAWAKAQRAALPEAARSAGSQAIAQRFLQTWNASRPSSLFVFLPMAGSLEVDTWPLIRAVWAQWPATRVLASVSGMADCSMRLFEIGPDTQLKTNAWGIPEPVNATPFEGQVDAVIVPLLTFDERGHRVGYGKGFYDRFLAGPQGQGSERIGVSLLGAAPQLIPASAQDQPLHACLTPEETYLFSR